MPMQALTPIIPTVYIAIGSYLDVLVTRTRRVVPVVIISTAAYTAPAAVDIEVRTVTSLVLLGALPVRAVVTMGRV